MAQMVLMERKDHKENKGLLDPLDQQDRKDHRGWQEQKVQMVLMEDKGCQHMKYG
jgi:hypothetical protein